MILLGTNITAAIEYWCFFLCVVCEIVLFTVKNDDQFLRCQKWMVFCNAIIVLSDGTSALLTGTEGSYIPLVIIVTNTIALGMAYIYMYFVGIYIEETLPEDKRTYISRANRFIVFWGLVLTIQNLFTNNIFYVDGQNNYCRSNTFWFSQIFAMAAIGHYMFVVIRYRKSISSRRTMSFLLFIVITFAASMAQLLGVKVTAIYAAMTLGTFLIIMNSYLELLSVLLEKEKRVTETNIDIVKSQIRPHFLYNCLNSIYYLCDDDPEKAKTAISDFSEYLRTDLDSLSGDRIIPFQKELEHVERYLRLEKMRFDDELTIVYEIKFSEFKVPSLTVQPLVENAIKHGISKKPGGGTIVISSDRKGNSAIIRVEDDGVGFNKEEVKQRVEARKQDPSGRSHIGMDNVERRVRDLAAGELTVTSEPGVGTRAVIVMPIVE